MQSWELIKFCWFSLWREYGFAFIIHVILPHPIRTVRGFFGFAMEKEKGRGRSVTAEKPAQSVVGLGFCLKPLDPVCISGRPNHDCYFLEHNLFLQAEKMPDCCRECLIRKIGTLALAQGYNFYIMTSARDILSDIFLPALRSKRFSYAILGLCRYSMAPFRIAMSIVGINGQLFPYQQGDCKDYRSWRQADIGLKNEQTELDDRDIKDMLSLLGIESGRENLPVKVQKKGNIFSQI